MCAGISYELKMPLQEIMRWKTKVIKDQYGAILAYNEYVKEHLEDGK